MLSNEFKVYVANNIQLVRSICIKSQQTIEATNNYLQLVGIDMQNAPESTYKYYVNLQGDYWTSILVDTKYKYNDIANDTMMYFSTIENNRG